MSCGVSPSMLYLLYEQLIDDFFFDWQLEKWERGVVVDEMMLKLWTIVFGFGLSVLYVRGIKLELTDDDKESLDEHAKYTFGLLPKKAVFGLMGVVQFARLSIVLMFVFGSWQFLNGFEMVISGVLLFTDAFFVVQSTKRVMLAIHTDDYTGLKDTPNVHYLLNLVVVAVSIGLML